MNLKELLLLAFLANAKESLPHDARETRANKLVDKLFDPAKNSSDSMLDQLADKLVDKLAGKLIDQLAGHLSVSPRTNVLQRTNTRNTYHNFASPLASYSPHIHKETTLGRQQVRTNAFFNFGKKKAVEPKPPLLISQDYKFAAGSLATTAALVGIKTAFSLPAVTGIFPLFFGALGALLTVQSGRVVFAFDDKAFEVRVKGSDGQTKDSGENFAVGGENRWNYNTFTRWNFIPSADFPLFMYFYETQTNGANNEQFHLFPVIMNSAELNDAMKERVGEDKIQPITFSEVVEGAQSADRVG
jgi:hypothetical protein